MEMIMCTGKKLYGKTYVYFGIFKCPECGVEIERPKSNGLKQELCRECGLSKKHKKMKETMTKHGGKGTRLYAIWNGIKDRTLNTKSKSYIGYGDRGITICKEWINDFKSFYEWSMNNGYNDTLTIDRINNDGNYEPSNCRWVDMKTQSTNKRNSRLSRTQIDKIVKMKIEGYSSLDVISTIGIRHKKAIENHFYKTKKDDVSKEIVKIKDYQRELNSILGA